MLFASILTATRRSFIRNRSLQTHCKCKTFPDEEKQQLFCLLPLSRK